MKRSFSCMLLGVAAGLAACNDSTAPAGLRRADLFNIKVPATARMTDTVRVSFQYSFPGCADILERIEVKPAGASLTFVVWGQARNQPCPLDRIGIFTPPTFIYLAAPPRPATYTVIFRQPVGDSVRIVTEQ